MSSFGEFSSALIKKYTYDVVENEYFWFGFLWGIPVPLAVLGIHIYLTDDPMTLMGVVEILKEHDFYWAFVMQPLLFSIVFGAFGTVKQAKELKINNLIARLKEEGNLDSLTGLYNRKYFESTLTKELARLGRKGKKLSVVVFDLDHFKHVNDTYGHLTGDKVLKTLGKILIKSCRPYDTPSRWGGEEFMVILPNTVESEAFDFAERIRSEFSKQSFQSRKEKFSCTLSGGISIYESNDTVISIVERGDKALYRAKDEGRNCIHKGWV